MADRAPVGLDEAICIVAANLAASEAVIGEYHEAPATFHARHRAEMAHLSDVLARMLGARVTDNYQGHRVRIAGITATSTSGLALALHNWLRAARARLGRAA